MALHLVVNIESAMLEQDKIELLRKLHDSPLRVSLVAAGGGSGEIANFFRTEGASQTFVDAAIPYSRQAMVHYLGCEPTDSHASHQTARQLAVRAFGRSQNHCRDEVESGQPAGIALVAALPTNRKRRGDDRIHVVSHSQQQTKQWSVTLEKDHHTRAEAENVADGLLLTALADLIGTDLKAKENSNAQESLANRITTQKAGAWRKLVDGEENCQGIKRSGSLVFPGSFSPVHPGHLQMAQVASQRYQQLVQPEVSISNVDKPPLDFLSIAERLTHANEIGDALLTDAPRFVDKAILYPGARFIVGADTALRLDNSNYYGGSVSQRDHAMHRIGMQGCRFVVFGRQIDGQFRDSHELDLSPALSALCDYIPATSFRLDISSRELRRTAT